MSLPKHHRKTIEDIAKNVLGLETLDTRKSDDLDFHEHAVWLVEAALEAAFFAGLEAAQKASKRFTMINAKGERVRVTIPED
jgi:hypothetical protein